MIYLLDVIAVKLVLNRTCEYFLNGVFFYLWLLCQLFWGFVLIFCWQPFENNVQGKICFFDLRPVYGERSALSTCFVLSLTFLLVEPKGPIGQRLLMIHVWHIYFCSLFCISLIFSFELIHIYMWAVVTIWCGYFHFVEGRTFTS